MYVTDLKLTHVLCTHCVAHQHSRETAHSHGYCLLSVDLWNYTSVIITPGKGTSKTMHHPILGPQNKHQ